MGVLLVVRRGILRADSGEHYVSFLHIVNNHSCLRKDVVVVPAVDVWMLANCGVSCVSPLKRLDVGSS